MVSVYGLIDPRNRELRYIGVTTQPLERRLSGHIGSISDKNQSSRVKWLRELVERGLRPEIFEIEVVDDFQEVEAERFYIQYFSYIGCRLTNVYVPYPPIDVGKSLPQEILDLMVYRKRGRPRCLPCVLCGDKGHGTLLIEGQRVALCKEHYNWYRRRKRAVEKGGFDD